MKLCRLDRRLAWPESIPAKGLCSLVREQLNRDGEPLRWAITAVEREPSGVRWLQVEAVVLA